MLKFLRKKGVMKKLLWVTAGIVIISFGLLGQSYLLNQGDDRPYAGKIFDHEISLKKYAMTFLHLQHQALLQYGEKFYKNKPFFNLNTETWDRLILLHEAKKKKIKATDKETIERISEFPFFQRDGKFDTLLYQNILDTAFGCGPKRRCKPRDFEEGIRETIILQKLYKDVTRPIIISEEKILNEYTKQNKEIQISYVLFSPEDYKKEVTFEETELQDHYNKHKNQFLIPQMVNVEYLSLEYPDNVTEQEKETIIQKANNISKEIEANPTFHEVAKRHNLPVEESGLFSQERPYLKIGWSYELLQKIFQFNINQISEPIETTKGYYILKIKEKREDYIPEYAEALEKVREAVILKKAKEIANNKAEEHLEKIKENFENVDEKHFTNIAQSLNLTTQQTPSFHRGQYLPNIGFSNDFQDVAFDLNDQKKISDVVETPKGYCILHLDALHPIDMDQFQKDKDEFSQALLQEEKDKLFNAFMARLRIKANIEDNISKRKDEQTQDEK